MLNKYGNYLRSFAVAVIAGSMTMAGASALAQTATDCANGQPGCVNGRMATGGIAPSTVPTGAGIYPNTTSPSLPSDSNTPMNTTSPNGSPAVSGNLPVTPSGNVTGVGTSGSTTGVGTGAGIINRR